MSTVEVCEICDIAECSHIRARRASTGFNGPLIWRPIQMGPTIYGAVFDLRSPRKIVMDGDGYLVSHPMAAPLKPRQSTLRVSMIMWKPNATNREVSECEEYLRTLGANGWRHTVREFGLYACTTVATWPESKQ